MMIVKQKEPVVMNLKLWDRCWQFVRRVIREKTDRAGQYVPITISEFERWMKETIDTGELPQDIGGLLAAVLYAPNELPLQGVVLDKTAASKTVLFAAALTSR